MKLYFKRLPKASAIYLIIGTFVNHFYFWVALRLQRLTAVNTLSSVPVFFGHKARRERGWVSGLSGSAADVGLSRVGVMVSADARVGPLLPRLERL